ncbi:MAG: YicC family protein [Bacteroidales bacterium]|nr:YicC family protein [Bacteroidales bacterium]
MLLSMTGFGRTVTEFKNKRFIIDVKSLNSRNTDINTRIPLYFKEKEISIRNLLSKELVRGKIDFTISVEVHGNETVEQLNEDLLVAYYKRLKNIAENYSIPLGNEILSSLVKFPDVFKSNVEELNEDEWEIVFNGVNDAIISCTDFRIKEGEMLQNDILQKNTAILELLEKVSQYEKERIVMIKEKLKQNIAELSNGVGVDANRYEQEIIFYLEKLDINEEKVRLKKHCEYFVETVYNEKFAGKKLGFISQEMGREINTLGSKAHHAEIQKIVVMMKDELEKIKEQLLNVL